MATVAEFTIDTDEFPLGRLFDDVAGVTLELERIVPTNKAIVPYLWVRGPNRSELEQGLSDLPEVADIRIVDNVDAEFLVRLTWERDYEGILEAIAETDVTLLSGIGSGDHWAFEIRGDDRDAVSAFQEYCRDHGIPIVLTGLHALSRMQTGSEYDLTDAQREALILAYDRGYYESPRVATLDELAADLGITGQSFGSRLRRGTYRLIGSTLIGQ